MKLQKLSLGNFQAARQAEIKPMGRNLVLSGRNGVGKSTWADAYFWMLTGKNSTGNAKFRLKTEDEHGQPIHHLTCSVTAEFVMDNGEKLTLEKAMTEKWEVIRNLGEDARMSGHTNVYRINGVPTQEAKFKLWLAEIAGTEERLRLLSDPTYFQHQITWQDRRRILLPLAGEITDDQVYASNTALEALKRVLAQHPGRSIDQHKEVCGATIKSTKPELVKIPARIDEVQRLIEPLEDWTDPRPVLKARIQSLMEQEVGLTNGGQIAEFKKKLAQLETEEIDATNRAQRNATAGQISAEQELGEIAIAIGRLEAEQANEVTKLGYDRKALDDLIKQIDILRTANIEINARSFAAPEGQASVCPTCGQDLPKEKLQAAIDEAEAAFLQRKSADLERNRAEGRSTKELIDKISARIAERQKAIAAADEALEAKRAELATKREIAAGMAQEGPADDKDLIRIQESRTRTLLDIKLLEDDAESARAQIKMSINEAYALVAAADAEAQSRALMGTYEARLEELRQEHRNLAATLEAAEGELFLCEEFTKTRMTIMHDRINHKFACAKFRLWEPQINGGYQEVCDVTFKGLPPSHGEEIKLGLDIINVLGDHYGFHPPIWVDNAEAVTDIPNTVGQQIRMVVAEHPTLHVEVL